MSKIVISTFYGVRTSGKWLASTYGPWYEDSNPEFEADTEEAAIAGVKAELRQIAEEIAEVLGCVVEQRRPG